jgi:hypothetical protein
MVPVRYLTQHSNSENIYPHNQTCKVKIFGDSWATIYHCKDHFIPFRFQTRKGPIGYRYDMNATRAIIKCAGTGGCRECLRDEPGCLHWYPTDNRVEAIHSRNRKYRCCSSECEDIRLSEGQYRYTNGEVYATPLYNSGMSERSLPTRIAHDATSLGRGRGRGRGRGGEKLSAKSPPLPSQSSQTVEAETTLRTVGAASASSP